MYLRIVYLACALIVAFGSLGVSFYQELGIAGLGLFGIILAVIGGSVFALLASGPGGTKALIDAAFPPEDRTDTD